MTSRTTGLDEAKEDLQSVKRWQDCMNTASDNIRSLVEPYVAEEYPVFAGPSTWHSWSFVHVDVEGLRIYVNLHTADDRGPGRTQRACIAVKELKSLDPEYAEYLRLKERFEK